jgi:hypothetical protein
MGSPLSKSHHPRNYWPKETGQISPAGLVSRKRGKPSNHQLPSGVAEHAMDLVRDRYSDFGPTLAREKLIERHGITLGLETVRRLMIEAGMWTPRRQRAAQIHQPRNRRACVGELIQIDGSDYAWFEDRAEACTLLVYIDDATSRLMQLHFVPTGRPSPISRPPVPIWSDTASRSRSTATRLQCSAARRNRQRPGVA